MISDEASAAVADSTITPRELRELLDADKKVALIDVREPVEWDIVHIDGAELVPKSTLESGDGLAKLPQDRQAVLYCKTGIRSAEALVAVKRRASRMRCICRAVSPPGPSRWTPTWSCTDRLSTSNSPTSRTCHL